MGFTVLHMYVDSLFVQRPETHHPDDFAPLLAAIEQQTAIPVTLEGVYRWIAFPPARQHPRRPVPNRYFGVFSDGRIKARGIALRRHDTPPFVAQVQETLIRYLAQAEHPALQVTTARAWVDQQLHRLWQHRVPVDDLRVAVKLQRLPTDYVRPSPAAQAAQHLAARGVTVHPGMRLTFWFTRSGVSVTPPPPEDLDLEPYARWVQRAAAEVLDVMTSIEVSPFPLALRLPIWSTSRV